MNKTFASISTTVIACAIGMAIGVTGPLAGVAGAQGAEGAPAPYNPDQKLDTRLDYVEEYVQPRGKQDVQSNALLALEQLNDGANARTPEFVQKRSIAEQSIRNAKEPSDTYSVIDDAAQKAGGGESGVVEPQNVRPITEKKTAMPKVTKTDDIVTVKLPSMYKDSLDNPDQYISTSVNGLMKNMPNACGAIIDLRGTNGRGTIPLLKSLQPLLPPGTVLYKKTSRGTESVSIENGRPGAGATPETKFTDIPVAILVDENTSGSGEAVALGFHGLYNVTTYGESGLSFAGDYSFKHMPDGSVLMIATSHYAARTGDVGYSIDFPSDSPEKDAAASLQKQCRTIAVP